MSGVYGDVLLYFPELLKDISVYNASPSGVAGYAKTFVKQVTGILQHVKQGKLDTEGETAIDTNVPMIWVLDDSLAQYQIVVDPTTGKDYRVAKDAPWSYEAGFAVYELTSAVGITDKQYKDPAVVPAKDFYS